LKHEHEIFNADQHGSTRIFADKEILLFALFYPCSSA
jgi:hypothetical protein